MPKDLKPQNPETHDRLQRLRDRLLTLHKTLVESEQEDYEKTFGKVSSANQLLNLVMNDPWFAWLHPLSLLIVSMDEALDEKKPLTNESVEALVKQSSALLVATEAGEGFSRHYFEALQRDPDVVMAHADAAKLFHPRKPAT